MFLDIVTPEKKVFSGEIKLISLPGTDGYFEVLENHSPVISTLKDGIMKIVEKSGTKQQYHLEGGVVEVKQNKVIVLADKLKETGV
jgi:F-type H+-transporting ATPase subunit epsilon